MRPHPPRLGTDPLKYPCCQGPMRRIETISRQEEIKFFLRLLGLWEALMSELEALNFIIPTSYFIISPIQLGKPSGAGFPKTKIKRHLLTPWNSGIKAPTQAPIKLGRLQKLTSETAASSSWKTSKTTSG